MPTAEILILTPVKDASRHLASYFTALERLTYPRRHLSLGFLEGDSTDRTFEELTARLGALRGSFRRVGLWRKHYGFRLPETVPRWAPAYQIPRRTILAKARNQLLFRALQDEAWVLWLDVDVVEYPPDILETLLGTGRDILHPHCVTRWGGPTFDLNAWRDHGRLRMQDLRGGPDLVRLDAVGGTMLLIRADIHRDGLIFPPFPYGALNPLARCPHPLFGTRRGELETEGLGLMAHDMGHQCWGLPDLEIRHAPE
jgi:hypothetical protein